MKKHKEMAIVLDNTQVSKTIYRLILQAPVIAREARPGQFVMVRVEPGYDPLLRRPFSFFKIDKEEGIIEIGYHIVGKGTKILASKKKGDFLDLVGPLGNGFRPPPEDAETVWFVAGGVGITALVPCIEDVRIKRPKTKRILFYGAKTSSELLPHEFLNPICNEIHYSTDDGSAGFYGFVPECIRDRVDNGLAMPDLIYACGPPVMLKKVAEWTIKNRIPGQFCLEAMMGCGLGACLGCAVPGSVNYGNIKTDYVHVCFEGPVFPVENIRWDEL